MDTVKFKNSGVKVIAHRGLSGIEAENTVSSFVAAANRTYWGIETDVHVTGDGAYVLIHDDTTERVCKEKLVVEKSSYQELSGLFVYDRFGNTRSDRTIPRLEDFLQVCSVYKKHPVIEFKNPFEPKNIKEVLGIVKNFGLLSEAVFISFSKENMINLRKLNKVVKAQLLTSEFEPELITFLKKYGLGIDISVAALTESVASKLKKFGIEINCWTCDLPENAERLCALGIDYITTNILE